MHCEVMVGSNDGPVGRTVSGEKIIPLGEKAGGWGIDFLSSSPYM